VLEGRSIDLLTPAGAAAAAVMVPVAKEAWSSAGGAGKVLAGLLLSARVWRVGRAVVVPSVTPVCAKNVPMAVRGVERRLGCCSDGCSWSVVVSVVAEEPTYRASRGGNFQSDSTAFGAVSSTSARMYLPPQCAFASSSPRLSFANRERQAAQSPEHEGRSREAGFFTYVGSLPFLLTGWPHDPV
jgi:hypothetical protein